MKGTERILQGKSLFRPLEEDPLARNTVHKTLAVYFKLECKKTLKSYSEEAQAAFDSLGYFFRCGPSSTPSL